MSELEKAFRTMQSGKTMGKIVVEMRPEHELRSVRFGLAPLRLCEILLGTVLLTAAVLVYRHSRRRDLSFYFDPEATYVIAGGLGGIGRSIASWFVDRARATSFFSHDPVPRIHHARELVERLAKQEARVATPACDITNAAELKDVLHQCSQHMPRLGASSKHPWSCATRPSQA